MSCKLFWRMVRLTYPWLPLLMTLWQIICSPNHYRHRAQVRFWILLGRIDFANLLAIVSDLIQPEYWA